VGGRWAQWRRRIESFLVSGEGERWLAGWLAGWLMVIINITTMASVAWF
jgi:hypothetical protein